MIVVECRTCRAPVFFAVNQKSGKREPIDAAEREDGNIEIVGAMPDTGTPIARHLKKEEIEGSLFPAGTRYVNHYATCPDAKIWRANSQASTKGST